MNTEIQEYHKNRTVLDTEFICAAFTRDERQRLKELQAKYPNHVIHLRNADCIAAGRSTGIGGSVPLRWNGLIYQTQRKYP